MKQLGNNGEIVCPEPGLWHEIYERLASTARDAEPRVPPPPRPLILGGWWGSTDLQKKARWEQTLEWAKRWDLEELIGELQDDQMYRVDAVTLLLPLLSINQNRNWNHKARHRPTDAEAAAAMELLQTNWNSIAGPLVEYSHPLSLTGSKLRRLLVRADPEAKPPWGDWGKIDRPIAIEFTRFRRAVNDAIQPHEVDHIDFIH